jgi:hypothetical protein
MFNNTADDNSSANTASPFDVESNNDHNDRDDASAETLPIENHLTTDTPPAITDIPTIMENSSIEDATEPRLKAVKASDLAANNKPESVSEGLNGHRAHDGSETEHSSTLEHREVNEEDKPASSTVENIAAVASIEHGEGTPDTGVEKEPEEDGVAVKDGEEEVKANAPDTSDATLEAQPEEHAALETSSTSAEVQPEEDVLVAPQSKEAPEESALEARDEGEEHKVEGTGMPVAAKSVEDQAGSEAAATAETAKAIATPTQGEEDKAEGATGAVLTENLEKTQTAVENADVDSPPKADEIRQSASKLHYLRPHLPLRGHRGVSRATGYSRLPCCCCCCSVSLPRLSPSRVMLRTLTRRIIYCGRTLMAVWSTCSP